MSETLYIALFHAPIVTFFLFIYFFLLNSDRIPVSSGMLTSGFLKQVIFGLPFHGPSLCFQLEQLILNRLAGKETERPFAALIH